jgi:hypothetical protein
VPNLEGFRRPDLCRSGRLLLPDKNSTTLFLILLIAGTFFALPAWIYAQSPPQGQCVFLGVKKSDRVGKTSAQPDGKPDAVFSVELTSAAATPRIVAVQIIASSPPGFWSSDSKTPGAAYIGVARAKNPETIMNPRGGPLSLNPRKDRQLLLFISDDGESFPTERRLELRVTQSDGTSWTVPVVMGASPPGPLSPAAETQPGDYAVRMSGVLKGISNYDAVNPSKKVGRDNKGDGLFQLTVTARSKQISAVEIRNVDGVKSVWDTVPDSSNGLVGVALTSEPVRLLNNPDGSVAVKIQGKTDLNLYVADNGSIADGKTSYRINVTFSDGEIAWCQVQSPLAKSEPAEKKPVAPVAGPHFLGMWLGFLPYDAVGKYSEMKSDGVPDAVFLLDMEVATKDFITGIEINSMDGSTPRWATGGGQGKWGLGVALKSAPGGLLNRKDGSVRIPIDERTQFYLYAADPGDLPITAHKLRLIVHLADGTSYQQMMRMPPATTSTVAPGPEEASRAIGILTCEFSGFIADLVNASTRPGKDGYLDGTFIMKVKVDDKKLLKVDILSADGAVRWSTDPKAPTIFLGVASYPAIYKLINQKSGPLQLPISGRRTLYLYAADNGMLSDPKVRLMVTVTFSDKTTLSTEVIGK